MTNIFAVTTACHSRLSCADCIQLQSAYHFFKIRFNIIFTSPWMSPRQSLPFRVDHLTWNVFLARYPPCHRTLRCSYSNCTVYYEEVNCVHLCTPWHFLPLSSLSLCCIRGGLLLTARNSEIARRFRGTSPPSSRSTII
jgi:hypothetical protein